MNVEAELVKYLRNALPDVDVHADVPADKELPLVTFECDGGTSDGIALQRPIVSIQCWDETRDGAAKLSLRVMDAMDACVGEPEFLKASMQSRNNFPAGDEPRYQLVYELVTPIR